MEERKFKVGDKVKGVGGDIAGEIMMIVEITNNGYIYLSYISDFYGNPDNSKWLRHLDIYDGILKRNTSRDGCIELLEESEQTTDYSKTYVKVENQEELDIAVKFYESKGYKKHYYTKSWIYDEEYDMVYIIGGHDDIHYGCDKSLKHDITEEVIGKRKYIPTTATEAYITDSKPTYYDGACSYKYLQKPELNPFGVSVIDLIDENQPLFDKLLNSKQPKKMSTLTTKLWDRFFKNTESKVLDLVENTNEIIEQIDDIIIFLQGLRRKGKDLVSDIDKDISDNDVSELKKDYKELKELYETKLSDKLLEQLFTIVESLKQQKKSKK